MARRRRRRLSLTPGEVRLYEHFLEHPHPTIKGHFEPLTPRVAHELAPTVVPTPAPTINRYGQVSGGALPVPPRLQTQLNPTPAVGGILEAPIGAGATTVPSSVTDALQNLGLLRGVEAERHKVVAANENIHPDVLAEAIGNTLLTAGIGGLANLGRGAVEAGVEGAASAGAGAAESASTRSAAQILADAARSVRQAPQAARDAAEALTTRAGQRAAAERAAGGAADFLLRHPKVTQVGGLGAVGAATGQHQGGLQIPSALVQGSARALEPAHIGNTLQATGRGLAGAITGPAALLYSLGESAIHADPNPFLREASGQARGIGDIFGNLLSGNPDVVQNAVENEVGLSLLPLVPRFGETGIARAGVDALRDRAKEARGAVNRRFGTDLRYGPEDQKLFGKLENRAVRRETAEEGQRATEPHVAIGHAEAQRLRKEARRIAGSRRLSNVGQISAEDLIQTLAETGLRRPEQVAHVRSRFPGDESASPRSITLHRVLDEVERHPEVLQDPAMRAAIEEYRGIQHRTPQHADESDLRATYSTQAHLFGIRDAVERIPRAVEKLLPDLGTGRTWSRKQAWDYVEAAEGQLTELRAASRKADVEARVLGTRVKEIERDERRRQRAAGAKVVSTDAPRRSDLPRSDGKVVRPAVKTRGEDRGARRLPESKRLQAEKAKLVDAQAEARGKRAEIKELRDHIREIKKGPGGTGGLNEYSRPWHAVSSRARLKLWSPEMVRDMAEETRAAAQTFGYDEPIYSHHGEAPSIVKAAGPRGGNIGATGVQHVRASAGAPESLAARDLVDRSFSALVEGSIEAPRRKAGKQEFARRFFSRHAIKLRVKQPDGTFAEKTRMTQDQYRRAVEEGQISSKGHVWVPESEYKQPFLQSREVEGSAGAKELDEGIRRSEEGSYGVVLNEERYKEYTAQQSPERGLAERVTNLMSKGAGRILLSSPAWVETQAVAELLPMVMAKPRLLVDPTHAVRLDREIRAAYDIDPNAAKAWAAVVGESPVRSASASELAPGYQPRTHGMFSEAARAMERTLPGRIMLSTLQLRPLIMFDQWRQGKYRQILAAAELDKQLNGFLAGLQGMLTSQKAISDELRGMRPRDAIVEMGRDNPRFRRLLDEQYRYGNDVMGNWTAFTRFERKFGPAAIFYGFLRYAFRWPLTFARRHPLSATINYFLGQANANELEKILGGKPASFIQYANPVAETESGPAELPAGSRIAPGLSPGVQGVAEDNLPGAVVGSLNPGYSALLGLVTGTNSFGQHDEDPGAFGLHWSLATKSLMSTPPLLRLFGVGSSHSQTSEELRENDPNRAIRSFAAPWLPLPAEAAKANNDIIKGVEEYERSKEENGGYAPSGSGAGNPFLEGSSSSDSGNPFLESSGTGSSGNPFLGG